MCGIAGSVNLLADSDRILDALKHRGPDGSGEQRLNVDGNDVWLGHTRLSILDLSSAGHQPMQSRDGRWWITFNGEIYNHLDLRQKLAGPFRGHSDTETLVELIAARGIEKVLAELNGMFAFAALDTMEGKLYLARDPFGIKPLYYVRKGDAFGFASEMRALAAMGMANNGVDKDALQLFLTLRYTPAPATLHRGVSRLEPGHLLTLDLSSGKVQKSIFMLPVSERFEGSLDEAVVAYQQALRQAVGRQLLSDVPVGVLLSGGIDSALIAAMARDLGQKLPCFTVGFGKGHAECEIADAAETASVLGLPFSTVEIDAGMLLDALPNIVNSVEEPLGTTSIMPMWYLVQRARKDVTVVLTGQGTDEPWGGYRRYQVEMAYRLLPWKALWRMARRIGGYIPNNLPEVMERGLRTLPTADMAARVVEACALFPAEERKQLLGSSDDGGARQSVRYWLDWLQDCDCEPAEKMMRIDARMNLADDLLLYGDKISMAVSLETRVPMLDIELVRFVESLPLRYRVALRRTKIVHKRMAEQYLPASIVHRRKRGFAVPFDAWSRGVWRDFVEDTLLEPNAPHFKVCSQTGVRRIWQEHLGGRPGRSRQVFALLMLALWWRQHV